MALTPPPAIGCGQFAALGPQLQRLAEKTDADMTATLQTVDILTVLDQPAIITEKTANTSVANGTSFTVLSFETVRYQNKPAELGYSTDQYSGNIVLPDLPHRRWYHIGCYITTAVGAPIPDFWKLRMFVDDYDPITNINNLLDLNRTFQGSAFNFAPGEHIWMETFTQSAGGRVSVYAAHSGAAAVNVTGGRLWAVAYAPKR